MNVELAEERILVRADRFNLDHAEGRAWAKRTDAFGTVAKLGGLLNCAGSEDYKCIYRERRLQPFWPAQPLCRGIRTHAQLRRAGGPSGPQRGGRW